MSNNTNNRLIQSLENRIEDLENRDTKTDEKIEQLQRDNRELRKRLDDRDVTSDVTGVANDE